MSPQPARLTSHPLVFHRAGSGTAAATPSSAPTLRRKKVVRRPADRTQFVRRSVQAGFLLLNLWIGARFYFFVRYFETGGQSVYVPRPAGIDGWLPIAALMNLKYLLITGRLIDVHAAGAFLLVSFAAISFFFRKAFCSWLCPIGTVSEWLWQGGRELFGRTFALPRWADIPLRGLKYLLLGLFLYAITRMSAEDIFAFMNAPYGLIADVKMLDFFRALSSTAAAVIVFLVVASIFVKNAWCRYVCPYGALMGLVALVSPARIRRTPDACIDCGKCAMACPSLLPVDSKITIASAECTNCLECVSICPVRDALALVGPRRRAIPGWAVPVGIAVLFLGFVGYGRASGHWHTNLPASSYFKLIPHASDYGHPGY